MFGTQNNYTKRYNAMSEAKNIGINPTNEPTSIEDIRNDRKQKLAATFRIFGKFGFDEGVAGHVTTGAMDGIREQRKCPDEHRRLVHPGRPPRQRHPPRAHRAQNSGDKAPSSGARPGDAAVAEGPHGDGDGRRVSS